MARLQDVNTTDVRSAIELGCRTMSSIFNADDNDIPFFWLARASTSRIALQCRALGGRMCPVAISMPCSTPKTRQASR